MPHFGEVMPGTIDVQRLRIALSRAAARLRRNTTISRKQLFTMQVSPKDLVFAWSVENSLFVFS